MKWFLFLFVAGSFLSCKNDRKEKPADIPNTIKDTVIAKLNAPNNWPRELDRMLLEDDTGYFKNHSVDTVSSIGQDWFSTGKLNAFLFNNLDTSSIRLLNRTGLAHSCWISPDTTIRIDTLSCNGFVLCQKINMKSNKLLYLKINNHLTDSYTEDLLDYNEGSFRDFIFKGKEYYFFTAMILKSSGGSASAIEYQLIYDKEKRSLNTFDNFRVGGDLLFGDLDGDDRLDFLEVDNDGGMGIDTFNHFKISVYSNNNRSGKFELLKDKSGLPYFIEGNSGGEYFIGDSMNITRSHWPKPLK